MRPTKLLPAFALLLSLLTFARAADLAGKWTAEFDTQIGVQKYTYEFKSDAGKFTGTARYENPMGKGEVALKDVKVTDADVTFTEPLKFNDMEVTITYKGKLAGDEVKFTRNVGDFATEELVAKRVPAPAAAPAKK